jgi:carboxylate-amine ligase
MRTVGVEEELLLVDRGTGVPVPIAQQLLASRSTLACGSRLDSEMQQEMLEVVSPPHLTAEALADDLRAGRRAADEAARLLGARAVALATSPLPAHPRANPSDRFQAMMSRYGVAARRSLVCGQHVHVAIESPDEGVAVLDRIRVWLPVLVALSANSPFADGEDTGHASYRSLTWNSWPCSGFLDVLGTAGAYAALEEQLLRTGVLLDPGMLYLAARLSRHEPTVEVRVADVCLDVDDAVLLAALVRGLVDTAAAEWRDGVPPVPMPTPVLRLAAWRAALSGVDGMLLHPRTGRPERATGVVGDLLAHVRPALEAAGDDDLVAEGLRRILTEGTGADRQRTAFRRSGRLGDVVLDAAEATVAVRPSRVRVPVPVY